MISKREEKEKNNKKNVLNTHFHKIFQNTPKLLPFGTSPEYEIVMFTYIILF